MKSAIFINITSQQWRELIQVIIAGHPWQIASNVPAVCGVAVLAL
jgi:hypothetical protein